MENKTQLTREERLKVVKLIKDSENLETIILKAHLYLEFWMNKVIELKFHKPKLIFDRYWQFSDKIRLLEATGYLDFPIILEQLREINYLRNQYSHNLYPKELEKRILKIPFNDVYGFGLDLDTNNSTERFKAIFLTVLTQIGNWTNPTNEEWAKDAMG